MHPSQKGSTLITSEYYYCGSQSPLSQTCGNLTTQDDVKIETQTSSAQNGQLTQEAAAEGANEEMIAPKTSQAQQGSELPTEDQNENARQKKIKNKAYAEGLFEQMKDKKYREDMEKQEMKNERDRLRGLDADLAEKDRIQKEKQKQIKRKAMQEALDHIAIVKQRRELEEKSLKTESGGFAFGSERKPNENVKLRQKNTEIVSQNLMLLQRDKEMKRAEWEKKHIVETMAKRDAQAKIEREEKKLKKALIQRSISENREASIKRKTQEKIQEQMYDKEMKKAEMEADRLAVLNQMETATRKREELKKNCSDFNKAASEQKQARAKQLKKEQQRPEKTSETPDTY
ncbi:trichohyalin-like [Kryptolebias marmoratus]|uniref:trichohyalin-like n=1 Tax=Kryptolebias marmoratus TaxID=37003 RepID=UPI0018ACEDB3|nr:trichohyalin-like [Kryptolebias marmoratus]